MKKKQNYKWIWLVVIALSIFYFVYSYLIVGIDIKPMQGEISFSTYKMELLKDNITFGAMPQGSVVKRDSRIYNNHSFSVKVYFFKTGELGEHVYVEPESLYLYPNKTKNVSLYFPMVIPEGNYQGNLIILTRRTIFGV